MDDYEILQCLLTGELTLCMLLVLCHFNRSNFVFSQWNVIHLASLLKVRFEAYYRLITKECSLPWTILNLHSNNIALLKLVTLLRTKLMNAHKTTNRCLAVREVKWRALYWCSRFRSAKNVLFDKARSNIKIYSDSFSFMCSVRTMCDKTFGLQLTRW